MSRRPLSAIAAIFTALATTLAVSTVANAAEPDPATPYSYSATAGGTYINALGGTATSDLTAESKIAGQTFPATANNTIATANVGTLLKVGAVETSVDAKKDGDVTTSSANAETANASLLNGLIKLNAATTKTEAKRDGTVLSGKSDTELLGLIVNGRKIGANPSHNFGIKINGVAQVTLNEQNVDIQGPHRHRQRLGPQGHTAEGVRGLTDRHHRRRQPDADRACPPRSVQRQPRARRVRPRHLRHDHRW